MRILWVILGSLCVALGTVGIAVPLLPTVPFMLLAAFCFARSSERLHNWLLSHPRFGLLIEDWRARGAISQRSKSTATVSITVLFFLSLVFGIPSAILVIQAGVLICVLVFIWTRPS